LAALIVLYGFTVATMSFACLAAIPLMPIGDLVVLCYVYPVFSVFLDRIVLKRALTFLSISLCFLIILGDILVVKPPFIFGDEDSKNETMESLAVDNIPNKSQKKHGEYYYVGVALCLYAAASGAVTNVVGAKCNQNNISSSQLMLVSGITGLILSLIAVTFLPNRLLTNPGSMSYKDAYLLPVSAGITMAAYWAFTLAISITRHPTLISMLHSTEILIALVTEALWWNELPDMSSLLGSLLVTACVLTMAGHDKIVATFKQNFSTKEKEEKETDVEELKINKKETV